MGDDYRASGLMRIADCLERMEEGAKTDRQILIDILKSINIVVNKT